MSSGADASGVGNTGTNTGRPGCECHPRAPGAPRHNSVDADVCRLQLECCRGRRAVKTREDESGSALTHQPKPAGFECCGSVEQIHDKVAVPSDLFRDPGGEGVRQALAAERPEPHVHSSAEWTLRRDANAVDRHHQLERRGTRIAYWPREKWYPAPSCFQGEHVVCERLVARIDFDSVASGRRKRHVQHALASVRRRFKRDCLQGAVD